MEYCRTLIGGSICRKEPTVRETAGNLSRRSSTDTRFSLISSVKAESERRVSSCLVPSSLLASRRARMFCKKSVQCI